VGSGVTLSAVVLTQPLLPYSILMRVNGCSLASIEAAVTPPRADPDASAGTALPDAVPADASSGMDQG
jgi:hypothetical protein